MVRPVRILIWKHVLKRNVQTTLFDTLWPSYLALFDRPLWHFLTVLFLSNQPSYQLKDHYLNLTNWLVYTNNRSLESRSLAQPLWEPPTCILFDRRNFKADQGYRKSWTNLHRLYCEPIELRCRGSPIAI